MTDDQFMILAGLLTEIRDVLVHLPDLDEECQHPEETRISLATIVHPDHWICGVCRFEHVSVTTN